MTRNSIQDSLVVIRFIDTEDIGVLSVRVLLRLQLLY